MNATPTARMSALYHALFDIYDSLIILATDLIQQHDTAASSAAGLADLTNLLAALSLPSGPEHRLPQVEFANLVSSFALCARAVERAAKTYDELKTELAGTGGMVLVQAWEKIDGIAQTVVRLCGVLKTIIGE